jgi:hypothetical protein
LLANTSRDLETFAKHAGRNIIQTEDVMLLTRRNEGLETVMKQFVDELRAKEGRPKLGTKAKGKAKAKR